MTVHPFFHHRSALWLALALACGMVAAQGARDPTQPPPELRVAPAEAKGSTLPVTTDTLTVLVRDGVPMLVQGTRLYKQGQQLGPYRIERISETEVWLRNGPELHKIARFAGIQRRAAAPERSTP